MASGIRWCLVVIACALWNASTAAGHTPDRVKIAAAALTTKVYEKSEAVLANPERGFFHQSSRCEDDDVTFSEAALDEARDEQIALIRCIFYLGMDATIDPDLITLLNERAHTARSAGFKLILRFAYSNVKKHSPTQPNDVPLAVVQSHQHQLAPVLQHNSDVIALVESGFVGAYGEGAYSEHFGDLGSVTEAQWEARAAVVTGLLDILPTDRTVVVRTPQAKAQMFDTGLEPAAEADVAAKTPIGRVGYFNDCFLRGSSDGGTYRDDADRGYVAAETRLLPMVGETCAVSSRSDCDAPNSQPNALTELNRFHWTALNADYKLAVLDQWQAHDPPCFDTTRKRLGYRLRLVSTRSSPSVRRGEVLPFRMLVRNTGWAATINPRTVFLVLRRTMAPHTVRRFPVGTTADWRAHAKRIRRCSIPIPANFRLGRYRMFLALPDPAPALSANPRFAIRLANAKLWRPATGRNALLRTVKVQSQAAPARQTGTRSAPIACTSQAG
jgi:hypothetical protein